jgi:hypothetical protein
MQNVLYDMRDLASLVPIVSVLFVNLLEFLKNIVESAFHAQMSFG